MQSMAHCHPMGVYPTEMTHPRQCSLCGTWYDMPCDCAADPDPEVRERRLWIDQTVRQSSRRHVGREDCTAAPH